MDSCDQARFRDRTELISRCPLADFSVYEYQKETGTYEPYRYEDRRAYQRTRDDGTYQVGPLYYNPSNQGRFMILETRSPYGYTIDRTTNRFYHSDYRRTDDHVDGRKCLQYGGNLSGWPRTLPGQICRLTTSRGKSKCARISRDEDTGKTAVRSPVPRFCATTGRRQDYELRPPSYTAERIFP